MFIDKEVPLILKGIIDKWIKEDKEFLINSDIISNYKGKKICYKYCNDEINNKRWYAKRYKYNDRVNGITEEQYEDIAKCLIQYYKPNKWTIILDYKCNYSCPMCPFQGDGYVGDYWIERQKLKRVMPIEEVKQIIDKLYNNNIYKICLTSPGELFLYPFWREAVSYAKSKKMEVSTITNGSLINESLCKEMSSLGIDSVSVSLDAISEETYSKVRSNIKQNYLNAINSPIIMKKHGINVNVHFVRQKDNIHETEEFVAYWKNKEVDSISIGYQTEYHDGYSKDVLDFGKDRFLQGMCSWYGNFAILADRTVTACCEMQTLYKDDYTYDLPRMDFIKMPYDEIVRTMNELMYKDGSPLEEICKRCAMFTIPVYTKEKNLGWTLTCTKGQKVWRRNEFRYLQNKVNELVNMSIKYDKRIMIYGAGVHTEELFEFTNIKEANIIGIVDRDINKQNLDIYGHTIDHPDEIINLRPDNIIISSKAFQDKIYEELKYLKSYDIEIVRLY